MNLASDFIVIYDSFNKLLCDIDYNSRTDVFRDVIYLVIDQSDTGARIATPAGTKCPPAAQRKQAKRDCIH